MSNNINNYLFYPANRAHVQAFRRIADHFTGDFSITAVDVQDYRPEEPGLRQAIDNTFDNVIRISSPQEAGHIEPDQYKALVMFAGDDALVTALAYRARRASLPVIGIEEGNQLALNDGLINFYGLPYTKLLAASLEEKRLFISCGHNPDRVHITGLCADDPADVPPSRRNTIRNELNIGAYEKVLVYASSPLQRQVQHSFDTLTTRRQILKSLKTACDDKWRILVKLHPAEDPAEAEKEIHSTLPGAIVPDHKYNILDILAGCDVLLNRGNSQVVIQALQMKRPVIIYPLGLNTIFPDTNVTVIDDKQQLSKISAVIPRPADIDSGDLLRHIPPHMGDEAAAIIAEYIESEYNEPLTTEQAFLFGVLFLEKRSLVAAENAFRYSAPGTEYGDICFKALQAAASSDYNSATKYWLDAAENKGYSQLYLEACRAASHNNEHEAALELLQKAQTAEWVLRKKQRYVIDMFRGMIYRRAGLYEYAIDAYDRILSDAEEYWKARYEKAATLAEAGRTDAAVQSLRSLLHDTPNCSIARKFLLSLQNDTKLIIPAHVF